MDADAWVVMSSVLIAVIAVVLGFIREHVLPRRHGRTLVESICTVLRSAHVEIERVDTVVCGQLDGCPVEVGVSPDGYAVVKTSIAETFLSRDLRIYETSSWSYQKIENRMLGLTADTGDTAFDAWFDVNGDDIHAATRLPERVRRVLVAHRRRGLMIVDGVLMLGSGSATPFGHMYQRPDTLDGVIEMLRAVTALALDLAHTP